MRGKTLSVLIVLSAAAAVLAAALVFGGILPPFSLQQVDESDYGPPALAFDFVGFADTPGWREDDHAAAVPVFLRSCARLALLDDGAPANPVEALGPAHPGLSLSGAAGDWRPACAAAAALDLDSLERDEAARAARRFFEEHFRPLRISSRRDPAPDGPARRLGPRLSQTGLFTGYFEPAFEASPVPTARFSAPLHARPSDLVMVDLGAFRPALAGERIAGYVNDGRLHPYPDHRAINDGALDGRDSRVLAFLDPNDLFFLQIQGSGRLRFEDGLELRVGYDGQNGHPYTPIGRVLIENGALSREAVSMQSIRAWLEAAAPADARSLREENASYVFFRPLPPPEDPALGPPGADGTSLTPGRSLAVDSRYFALGLPVWVSIPGSESPVGPIRRLFIAQDTGGAIRGPVRGDIFFGAGPEAGEIAGLFQAEGELIALLPARVAGRLAMASARDRS